VHFHLYLAVLLLLIVAFTDTMRHRIPNTIFGVALLIHLLAWLLGFRSFELRVGASVAFILIILLLMLFDESRKKMISLIGMGDIKLVAYAILVVSPYLSALAWLLSISLASLLFIALLALRGYSLDGSRIPFAPPFFMGTVVALAIS
jgi:Flp pilus assembly protein protease CpaA